MTIPWTIKASGWHCRQAPTDITEYCRPFGGGYHRQATQHFEAVAAGLGSGARSLVLVDDDAQPQNESSTPGTVPLGKCITHGNIKGGLKGLSVLYGSSA